MKFNLITNKGDKMKKVILLLAALIIITGCSQGEKKVEGTNAVAEPKTEPATKDPASPQNADIDGQPQAAGAIMFTDLKGEQIDLKNFGGKMMILDFWATHCPPCKQEMPVFNKLYKEYKDDGLVIVAVSLDRGRAQGNVQPFVDDLGLEFHIGYPTREIMMEWGSDIKYIPTTYIIDANGKIHERVVGGQPESFWKGYIDKLILETA